MSISNWTEKSDFTLDEVIELITAFQAKGFKGAVGVAFDESQNTQIADTVRLKAIPGLTGTESMQALLYKEKPDLTVNRLLEMLPVPDKPSATILRAFVEIWRLESKRGMSVFTSPFHIWKNTLNGRSVIMGMPDGLCYVSAVLFMQTSNGKFQLGRLSHEVAVGGALEYLL